MTEAPSRRILVVDDEEDVQILVHRILRDVGYDVDSAADGAEAIEKIEARRPDLVVLDLMMPGIDGWGVLEHLRGKKDRPPVVVMTALADFTSFSRGVREGIAAYVCKPFHFAELVATCQRVLMAGAQKAPAGAERRREPRRQLMVEVKVLSQEKRPIALGELVNLSAGGAQIELGVPLEPGERVRVAFHIPSGAAAVSLEGRVQWRQPAQRGYSHGLAFSSLAPEEQGQLRDLLQPPS